MKTLKWVNALKYAYTCLTVLASNDSFLFAFFSMACLWTPYQKLQVVWFFRLILLILETLTMMFRETEIYSSRVERLKDGEGIGLRELLYVLTCQPQLLASNSPTNQEVIQFAYLLPVIITYWYLNFSLVYIKAFPNTSIIVVL